MAYTDSKRPADRAASVAGVIAIHAALGYALVIGLQATGVIPPPDPPFEGTTVVEPIPIPPPPKPTPDPKTPVDSKVYTPEPVLTINTNNTEIDATTVLPPPGDIVVKPNPGPIIIPSPGPAITPVAEAIAARARNNPGGWITEADYKTSWIIRGYAGTAGFRLAIGASGRVEGCQITRSTGHAALDEATCALVAKRARFEPARNGAGDKVPGSYASSVLWQIPED